MHIVLMSIMMFRLIISRKKILWIKCLLKCWPINTNVFIRYFNLLIHEPVSYFVGNKAKGRISKRVFQENKARQISRKRKFFYPLIRTGRYCYNAMKSVKRLYEGLCEFQKIFRWTLKTWKTFMSSFHCLQKYCLFCQLTFY